MIQQSSGNSYLNLETGTLIYVFQLYSSLTHYPSRLKVENISNQSDFGYVKLWFNSQEKMRGFVNCFMEISLRSKEQKFRRKVFQLPRKNKGSDRRFLSGKEPNLRKPSSLLERRRARLFSFDEPRCLGLFWFLKLSRTTQLHEYKYMQSPKLKTHRKTTKFKQKHVKLKHDTKKKHRNSSQYEGKLCFAYKNKELWTSSQIYRLGSG
ncbi:hypothetical protein AXX17_AT1G41840 [Arabidopsis thaliana]|uniref:Uncharacterized protein n=1 Tax=Arabidopsis thaliana TaxID=3702 RepID=A0A178WPG5_ARATH|nr:hypothetical protein AXX17_AT1G41840 [Arabidopsis thaliana]